MRRKKGYTQIYIIIVTLIIIVIFSTVLIIYRNSLKTAIERSTAEMTIVPTLQPTTEPILQPTTEPIPEPTVEPVIEPTAEPVPVPEIPRRGWAEAIPDEVRAQMSGVSMPSGATIGYDDLSYLTIPHYDFNYTVTYGHMVVSRRLAEEVLDIFAELFDIQYPIERMELVDNYGGDDYESIENNNTSAFNYRESTDGSGRLSKHALGCAIDINPQINPYVNSGGVGSHSNAMEYWSRDYGAWSSAVAKAAYIGYEAEIYRIFVHEHGWEWGGSWSSYRDYQHFQKTQ